MESSAKIYLSIVAVSGVIGSIVGAITYARKSNYTAYMDITTDAITGSADGLMMGASLGCIFPITFIGGVAALPVYLQRRIK